MPIYMASAEQQPSLLFENGSQTRGIVDMSDVARCCEVDELPRRGEAGEFRHHVAAPAGLLASRRAR
jgi:hypothetical protein